MRNSPELVLDQEADLGMGELESAIQNIRSMTFTNPVKIAKH
jgi:hypothetical protein